MAKHDVIAERPTRSIVDIPINSIKPDADQPRKTFPDDHIKGLADSIRERGLIQPIIVRPIAEGGYIIVAGECRWRACKLLELPSICCVVEDIDDREARLRSIVENLQRRDMNPIDEARAFKCLLDDGYSVERIVKDLGLNSASIVRQRLDLLNLTPEISQLVLTKNLPVNMAWGIALAPPQISQSPYARYRLRQTSHERTSQERWHGAT